MLDLCILVTGQSHFVDQVKKSFSNFNGDLLFSCWRGEESKYEDTDRVLYNEPPSFPGSGNINLQKVATLNGLLKAKELGYSRVLKIRSDLVPSDDKLFMQLFDNDKINLLCWHQHWVGIGGYFVDYLMSGKVSTLIDVWSNLNTELHSVSEVVLTEQLIKHHENIQYFLNDLNPANDLNWLKYNRVLSSYKQYSEYCYVHDYDPIINAYTKLR